MNSSHSSLQKRHGARAAWFRLLMPVCLGALFAIAAGCRSPSSSGTVPMASTVLIHSSSAGVVRGATIDVFEGAGYKLGRRDAEIMVFEKQASKMTDLTWGNWTETRVWNRVKVYLQTVNESSIRLSCTGFMVRDKGAATEEEIKAYRQSPYKKLLDQVAARLKAGSDGK